MTNETETREAETKPKQISELGETGILGELTYVSPNSFSRGVGFLPNFSATAGNYTLSARCVQEYIRQGEKKDAYVTNAVLCLERVSPTRWEIQKSVEGLHKQDSDYTLAKQLNDLAMEGSYNNSPRVIFGTEKLKGLVGILVAPFQARAKKLSEMHPEVSFE